MAINLNIDLNETKSKQKRVLNAQSHKTITETVRNIFFLIVSFFQDFFSKVTTVCKFLFTKKYFWLILLGVIIVILALKFGLNNNLLNLPTTGNTSYTTSQTQYEIKVYKGKSSSETSTEISESKYKEEKFISIQSDSKEDKTVSLKIIRTNTTDSSRSFMNKSSIRLLANQVTKYQLPAMLPVGNYEILLFENLDDITKNEVIISDYQKLKAESVSYASFKVIE